MTTMLTDAYARGRQAACNAKNVFLEEYYTPFAEDIKNNFAELREVDVVDAIVRFDRERMENPPDLLKYPETKGLPDIVRAERRGFLDEFNGNEVMLAMTYSAYYYYTKRILTKYLPVSPVQSTECTAVFIRDSAEGGPLYGRNWDGLLGTKELLEPPREAAPDEPRRMWIKGVSGPMVLDEEPDEIFPVDPFALLPEECTDHVKDAVEFLSRYRQFWGPGNDILIDKNLDSVAIEKANIRMGVREPVNGASAVTAMSYLTPEMHAYKLERERLSIERRGWDFATAPDWIYWRGADERHKRLLALVEEASKRSPSLQDMATIVTDHAVPYPARVCLAGQSCIKGLTPDRAEWTVVSHSEVLEGPNRRMLFYVLEGDTPCYDNPPYLVLGAGVAVKPEWLQGTRPIPTIPQHPRPRIHCEHPHIRVML